MGKLTLAVKSRDNERRYAHHLLNEETEIFVVLTLREAKLFLDTLTQVIKK